MLRIIRNMLALLCVLLSSAFCSAFAAEQAVEATGYGSSRNLAISDALVQGVRQATGVSVDSQEMMQSLSARVSETASDGSQSSSSLAIEQSGQVSLETQGLLSRYDIHQVSEEAGGFRADVTVYVLKYDKPGFASDSRRTLAVLPFHHDKSSFSLLGDVTPASRVEAELRNRILDQFTQSRRLNVLDREFGAEFAEEKALWVSDDAALAEQAKAGNVLGADYIVVGSIRQLKSIRNTRHLQLTDETITSYHGVAQLDYKIILAATRQVKWSDTITVKFSDADIRSMLSKFGSSQTGIVDLLSRQLVQQALANIYPMRVVAVKGKTVVLNQGGKTLKPGDKLDIYLLGEEMIDPYTGESLGQLEEKIARVKVMRVNSKTTYAKVFEGDAELIEPDFIARR